MNVIMKKSGIELVSSANIRKLAARARPSAPEKISFDRDLSGAIERGKLKSPSDAAPWLKYAAKSHEARLVARTASVPTHYIAAGNVPKGVAVTPIPRERKIDTRTLEYLQEQLGVPTDQLMTRFTNLNLSRMDYPWRTIGRISVTAEYTIPFLRQPITVGVSGTAVLIGRSTLLTASHVLPWGATRYWGTFTPALSTTDPIGPFGTARISSFYGYRNSSAVCGYDISAVQLDRPIGDQAGWMGYYYSSGNALYYDGSFYSGGYPAAWMGTADMTTMLNVKVQDVDTDKANSREIETDPFTNHGWSGGPLFTWVKDYGVCVVGVLSGREKDFLNPEHSVWAGGPALGTIASWARTNWG